MKRPPKSLENEKAKTSANSIVREIKRKTRRVFSAEEKFQIVLQGLRGKDSIAGLCRKHGIQENNYYNWSKEFQEAGNKVSVLKRDSGLKLCLTL